MGFEVLTIGLVGRKRVRLFGCLGIHLIDMFRVALIFLIYILLGLFWERLLGLFEDKGGWWGIRRVHLYYYILELSR